MNSSYAYFNLKSLQKKKTDSASQTQSLQNFTE